MKMDEEQKTRIEDTAALLSPNKVPSDKHKQVDEVELEEQEDLDVEEHQNYTFEEAVESMGFGRFHWTLLLLCGVGYFAEITELVVVSFVAPAIEKEWNLSSIEYGLLGSSSFIGMTVGAIFWGYISDRFGRQISFSLTVWMTFAGGLLSAFSPNYIVLLLLRILAAVGIGGMLPVDYTVFLEFLPKHKRGSRIVSVDAIGVIPALTLSTALSYFFSGSEDIKWRWVLGLSAVPVGIMAVARQHVPESPRYHLTIGETDKAQKIIENVAKMNKVTLPPGKLVYTEYSSSSNEKHGAHSLESFKQLFEGETLKATTPRLWALWFCTQFSSSGMGFALPKLLEDSFNISKKRQAVDLLWGVFGLVPGLCIAYFVVEKSRKYSLAGYYVASAMSVVLFSLATVGPWDNEIFAVFASMMLRGSMEGCFAILNTTSVESYPTTMRASGLGNAQMFDHIAGILSPLFFGIFNGYKNLRPVALSVYGAVYMLAFVPAFTLPKDYAGKAVKDTID